MKHNGIFKIAPQGTGALKWDVASLGLKAYGLARMARLGLPVPHAFVLGTPHCRLCCQNPERFARNLDRLLEEPLHWLQSVTGLGFGDTRRPLLVSVRSGAPVSMPGMMDTLLNIGLCDATAHGLLRLTGNPRLVWDSYRRLIQDFAEVVYAASPQPFAAALDAVLARERLSRVQELDYLSLTELCKSNLRLFFELTGREFPQSPLEQLELAVKAVFASWNSPRAIEYRRIYAISGDLCTAVTVQQMVFGNTGGTSGAGVGFTRDPDSGEKRLYFDFLFNSQGEDVVSGRTSGSDETRLFLALPETEQALLDICATLEKEYGDAQEFEFSLQDGVLYLLQTRSAKRTPWAALRIAVELVGEGLVEKSEALARLSDLALPDIRRQRLACEEEPPLCQGQAAGIGVASGPLAIDLDAVRTFSEQGRPAVLVREEMATADIAGIALSAGVLTVRGNRTSHAAVVARQMGKACITGCTPLLIDASRRVVEFGARSLAEGEPITLDSNTGRVFAGEVAVVVDYPTPWLAEIESWRREQDGQKKSGD
jgi:pyruvate,orthophosphate dikinase